MIFEWCSFCKNKKRKKKGKYTELNWTDSMGHGWFLGFGVMVLCG